MEPRTPLLTVTPSPHLHSGLTTRGMMGTVFLALLPAVIAATYLFGLPALRVLLICVTGSVAIEALWQTITDQQITVRDGSAALTGLLVAFNLPASSPWWLALLGATLAIMVGKQVFGGLGHNPFNPALVARIILLISFPTAMTHWTAPQPGRFWADAITAATPLSETQSTMVLSGHLPQHLSGFSGRYLLGNMSGCLGEVSALLLLLGALFLLWRRVISWHIPVSYLGTVALLSGIFWLIDPSRYPSPGFQLVSGGLMLGACYMATDLVTSPLTARGMLIFGIGCGLITVLIRLFGSYPEGVAFSILLMNAVTPLIDRYVVPRPFGMERSGVAMNDRLRFVIVLTLITSISGLVLGITERYTRQPITQQHRLAQLQALRAVMPEVDNAPDRDTVTPAMQLSPDAPTPPTTYYRGRRQGQIVAVAFEVVAHHGYGGPIRMMVGIMPDGKLLGVEILQQNETPGLGNRIEEKTFRDQFLGKSLASSRWKVTKDGGDFDQISGATISSRALVKGLAAGLDLYHRHSAVILATPGAQP